MFVYELSDCGFESCCSQLWWSVFADFLTSLLSSNFQVVWKVLFSYLFEIKTFPCIICRSKFYVMNISKLSKIQKYLCLTILGKWRWGKMRKNDIYFVKSVRVWRYSSTYFRAFGLSTEIYRINLWIQFKKTWMTDTFTQ